MKSIFSMLPICLALFDGAAAAGGEGAGAAAPGTEADGGNKAGSQALPGSSRRGKKSGGLEGVVYGKQAAAQPTGDTPAANNSVAGSEKTDVLVTSDALEDKRKAFRELVNGEYKDIYTEDTQRMIDRRFRETKTLQEQLSKNQPILDMLMQRYKVADGDIGKLQQAIENDNAYWSQAADEAGMDVEQYKQFQKLQRENEQFRQAVNRQQNQQAAQQQLQNWYAEGDKVKAVYPAFDLAAESKNPDFLRMLKSGVPVQHAYEVLHLEDIKQGVAQSTAKQTERQVVSGIQAKGNRPAENGTSSQSAFTVKDDPHKWSKKDREEVARRVARGEQIKL